MPGLKLIHVSKSRRSNYVGEKSRTGEFPAQMASNAEMFPFDDVIMWTCSQVKCHRTPKMIQIDIGWGIGLVSSGNKPLPEPILTTIYDAMWCHYATKSSYGHIE